MTLRHLLSIALGCAGCAAMPALAQFGNPGFQLPGTVEAQPGVPAPNQYNTVDRLFVKLLGAGNAAPRLAAVARTMNLPANPEPDPDQKAARARLEGLQGAAFDAAYLQSQLIDHQKTVQLLIWQIGQGQDAALQSLAMELLPTVVDHLREAQALYAEHTGAGLQGLAVADAAADPSSRRRAAP
ncbi:MAG TPA: DUF4142 domain-containing protein [Rhizobacter sp.]